MGRYPFTECLNEFLPLEEGHISTDSLGTMYRRLRQIGRIFKELKEEGKVSTDNPRFITPRDVDIFVGYRKKNGIKNTTILKDLSYMSKLFGYFDNEAVYKFKFKYPAHYPKKYQKRMPSMEEPVVQRILDAAEKVSVFDWKMSEAYGLVTLAVCTGFRPKELRMLSLSNVHIDGNMAEIYAVHVKGEDTYGSERWVTVHPDGVPLLKKYIEARKIRLFAAGRESDSLFPPLMTDLEYISYKRIRVLKTYVEEDLGEQFELRKCRRTFGQRALNEGQDIHNVSIVMGHSTLATTQRYYCDKELHAASSDMRDFWTKNQQTEDV